MRMEVQMPIPVLTQALTQLQAMDLLDSKTAWALADDLTKYLNNPANPPTLLLQEWVSKAHLLITPPFSPLAQ